MADANKWLTDTTNITKMEPNISFLLLAIAFKVKNHKCCSSDNYPCKYHTCVCHREYFLQWSKIQCKNPTDLLSKEQGRC